MFLRKITERSGYDCGQYVRWRRIPAAHLYKEFQAAVVDEYAGQNHHQVAKQLRAAQKRRPRKTDVAVEPKAGQKGNRKFEYECGYVGRESHKAKIDHLRMKYIVVKHKVKHPVEEHVQSAGKAVTEKIVRHQLCERLVEKVDNLQQGGLCYFFDFSHLAAAAFWVG